MGRLRAASPEILDRPGVGDVQGGEGWIVTVFDNDRNTFDQVAGVLVLATGCTIDEAEIETWEVHHLGRSVVHQAGKAECERAAGIIRRIGIRVAVTEG